MLVLTGNTLQDNSRRDSRMLRSDIPRVIRNWVLPCCLAIGLVAILHSAAWACPTCKDSIAQSDPSQSAVARGYYWSILFMMAMPFTLLSALGGYFYWEIRKARGRQASTSAEPVPGS